MNEETTQVVKTMNKETVEQAIDFILEEGKEQGYQEAMKIYGKQYADVIRKGRRQGFLIAAVLFVGSFIMFKVNQKKIDAKLKEIFGRKDKEPIDIDPEEVFEDKEE